MTARLFRRISPNVPGASPEMNRKLLDFEGRQSDVETALRDIPSRYSPIEKGITGGDDHTHTGGQGAAITEDGLSFSNVRTADAQIGKHGLMPALPGMSNKFLNGNGQWVKHFGSGTFTMAAAATMDIDDVDITVESIILLVPNNADAAALQAGNSMLWTSSVTEGESFTVETADGNNAAGTEEFRYLRFG